VRFSPTQITQLHPKPSHHTLPQRTRRRPPNERDDRTNRLHENREDNDRKRPTERANPRRVRGGQGRARGTRVPGSAGASAAARRPTRRSSRRRGMTRMRRRTRSPAWAGTCGEINKPPKLSKRKKKQEKKEERKKPPILRSMGEAGSANPAASMAAANGGERRAAPGGRPRAVGGGTEPRGCEGEEKRSGKREIACAPGDLSRRHSPTARCPSLPRGPHRGSQRLARDASFQGGPPVSVRLEGGGPRGWCCVFPFLFGDDDAGSRYDFRPRLSSRRLRRVQ